MRKIVFQVIFLGLFSSSFAQKAIKLEDALGRTFLPERAQGFNWMKDSRYYTTMTRNAIIKRDLRNKSFADTLFSNPTLSLEDYSFSPLESKILLKTQIQPIYRHSYRALYYLYDLKTKKISLLNDEWISYATFSPDEKKIAYTKANDLFVYDIESQKERQITFDGKFNSIINGSTDWVNEEEFGFAKAFWWSADSKHLAYLTFDETEVKEYNMQIWGSAQQLYPSDYRFKYPKAGQANSHVYLSLHNLDEHKKIMVNFGDTNFYLPRIQWTNDPHILSIRKLNRLQNKLEILHFDVRTQQLSTLYQEQSSTYIDLEACEELIYWQKKPFVLLTSESDGHKHIYQYSTNGKLIAQLTKGNFDISELLALDESGKEELLYFTSNEESLLGKSFYVLNLKSGKKQRLSPNFRQEASRLDLGSSSVTLSRDLKFYELTHSSSIQPPTSYLYDLQKNTLIDTLVSNRNLKVKCQEYGFGLKETFRFKTPEGHNLYGYMIKPQNFDTTQKYPLLIHTYGGPGRQMVSDSWAGSNFSWHQYLAQQGYLVVVVDNRGVPGYGAAFKKATYGALGNLDSQDQIYTAEYLISKGYVDANRIGIWGWSYGGYMSAVCAMRAPKIFKVAISVAPVTSWRFYDTIYTERFLGLPQDNPEGYDRFSPLSLAKNLKAKFLLIHGTGDDNVHIQNSMALQNELIKANIQFDAFYYPDRNHGIYGGNTRLHLYKMMTDFIVLNL
jgi:dipeptidyl-peptidase-4